MEIDDFKVPGRRRRHSWRDLEVLAQILEPWTVHNLSLPLNPHSRLFVLDQNYIIIYCTRR